MRKPIQIGKQAFNPDQIVNYDFLEQNPWKKDSGPCVVLYGADLGAEEALYSLWFGGDDYDLFMWWWQHKAGVFDVAKEKAAAERTIGEESTVTEEGLDAG